MSSREHRGREDRDRDRYSRSSYNRRRSSRSRSPRRDRRDYRDDDRRDRDSRKYESRHDRDYHNDRDARYTNDKGTSRRKERSTERSRDAPFVAREPPREQQPVSNSRPNLDPDAPEEGEKDDVPMDAEDDDAAAMAMMGLSGFGSTKGKQVEGNQDGAVHIKKMRTWRQYMNRRGGFNRPLDKIK